MAKKESEDAMIAVSVRLMFLKLLTKCWKKMMKKMPSALSPMRSVERLLLIVWVLCWTCQTVRRRHLVLADVDLIVLRLCGRFGVVVEVLRIGT